MNRPVTAEYGEHADTLPLKEISVRRRLVRKLDRALQIETNVGECGCHRLDGLRAVAPARGVADKPDLLCGEMIGTCFGHAIINRASPPRFPLDPAARNQPRGKAVEQCVKRIDPRPAHRSCRCHDHGTQQHNEFDDKAETTSERPKQPWHLHQDGVTAFQHRLVRGKVHDTKAKYDDERQHCLRLYRHDGELASTAQRGRATHAY